MIMMILKLTISVRIVITVKITAHAYDILLYMLLIFVLIEGVHFRHDIYIYIISSHAGAQD